MLSAVLAARLGSTVAELAEAVEICEPAEVLPLPTGRVERRDRLGGSSTNTAGAA